MHLIGARNTRTSKSSFKVLGFRNFKKPRAVVKSRRASTEHGPSQKLLAIEGQMLELLRGRASSLNEQITQQMGRGEKGDYPVVLQVRIIFKGNSSNPQRNFVITQVYPFEIFDPSTKFPHVSWESLVKQNGHSFDQYDRIILPREFKEQFWYQPKGIVIHEYIESEEFKTLSKQWAKENKGEKREISFFLYLFFPNFPQKIIRIKPQISGQMQEEKNIHENRMKESLVRLGPSVVRKMQTIVEESGHSFPWGTLGRVHVVVKRGYVNYLWIYFDTVSRRFFSSDAPIPGVFKKPLPGVGNQSIKKSMFYPIPRRIIDLAYAGISEILAGDSTFKSHLESWIELFGDQLEFHLLLYYDVHYGWP